MKFINYLESISGISVFPMISLLVFFLFFMGLFIRVYYLNNNTIAEISNLPLEDEFKDGDSIISPENNQK